jgi:hypothetical protein
MAQAVGLQGSVRVSSLSVQEVSIAFSPAPGRVMIVDESGEMRVIVSEPAIGQTKSPD